MAVAQDTLVLVHGFGVDARHFAPWLPLLREHVDVITLDLPGFGSRVNEPWPATLDALVDDLLPQLPARAMYCGWSAGGMVVSHLARRYPARVSGLLLLAANPTFVARDDAGDCWPGMAPELFRQFAAGCAADLQATLKRFEKLVTLGAPDARTAAREIATLRAERFSQAQSQLQSQRQPQASQPPLPQLQSPEPQAAMQYLQWLGAVNYRALLCDLRQPVVALFAGNDALVPVHCADALRQLLPGAQISVIENCSHWLQRDDPSACTRALQVLQARVALHELAYRRDKRDVAQAFSRAASRYENVAQVQADVRAALLARCDRDAAVQAVLDLGCGTGAALEALRVCYPPAAFYGVDLAQGMLQVARERHPDTSWVAADAETLPLTDGCIDRIFSSLALQWCEAPTAWLAEMYRVLAPGGRACVATLADGTLHELFQAWREVDPEHVHVNAFASVQELRLATTAQLWAQVEIFEQPFCDVHDSLRGVLASIRDIGAHNVNAGRARGLTGRKQLLALQQAYEAFRTDSGLPVTYRVVFLELVKPNFEELG